MPVNLAEGVYSDNELLMAALSAGRRRDRAKSKWISRVSFSWAHPRDDNNRLIASSEPQYFFNPDILFKGKSDIPSSRLAALSGAADGQDDILFAIHFIGDGRCETAGRKLVFPNDLARLFIKST